MTARLRAAGVLPLVAAASIPFVFLHARYQWHGKVGPADVYGSDLAIALVVASAIVSGVLFGWRPLRRMRVTWILIAALMGLFVISCLWRPIELPSKHLTTAAKMIEYALLAPSIVLLLRRRVDVDRFLYVFVGWALAAALWGVLMFLAIVDDPEGPRPGQREVSFLGHQDFGTFTGAALAIGFSALALGDSARARRRRDHRGRDRRDPRRVGLRLLRLPARHRRRGLDRPARGDSRPSGGASRSRRSSSSSAPACTSYGDRT